MRCLRLTNAQYGQFSFIYSDVVLLAPIIFVLVSKHVASDRYIHFVLCHL
jgi:hypothetical protein